jgi:hypothetical protein
LIATPTGGAALEARAATQHARRWTNPRHIVTGALLALIVTLSALGPVPNLISAQQVMNTSFDPLRLVNTYGAFGVVSRERDEVVLLASLDGTEGSWREIAFPCKPGAVDRAPCVIAPYQLRLDWQVWGPFMSGGARSSVPQWFVALAHGVLVGDAATLALLDPAQPFDFAAGERPAFVKADMFRYRFAAPGRIWREGIWWDRERIGPYMRPLTREELGPIVRGRRQ